MGRQGKTVRFYADRLGCYLPCRGFAEALPAIRRQWRSVRESAASSAGAPSFGVTIRAQISPTS